MVNLNVRNLKTRIISILLKFYNFILKIEQTIHPPKAFPVSLSHLSKLTLLNNACSASLKSSQHAKMWAIWSLRDLKWNSTL
jgi:hypothetical protein